MKKLKLSFDALKKDMDTISSDEQTAITGGDGRYYGYNTWGDFICAVEAGQFVTPGTYENPDDVIFAVPGYNGDPAYYYGIYGPYTSQASLNRQVDLSLGSATYIMDGYEVNLNAAHCFDPFSFFQATGTALTKLGASAIKDTGGLFVEYTGWQDANLEYANLQDGNKQLVGVHSYGNDAAQFITDATGCTTVGSLTMGANENLNFLQWFQDGGVVVIGRHDESVWGGDHWYTITLDPAQQGGLDGAVYTVTDSIPDSSGNFAVTTGNFNYVKGLATTENNYNVIGIKLPS